MSEDMNTTAMLLYIDQDAYLLDLLPVLGSTFSGHIDSCLLL
jgi:hypothetical protein